MTDADGSSPPTPPTGDPYFQLKHLQESSIAIWGQYITWFTWFVTTSIVILGWFATSKEGINTVIAGYVCNAMIGATILGALAAGSLLYYDSQARNRAIILADVIGGKGFSTTVARWVTGMAGFFMLIGLVGLCSIWIFVDRHVDELSTKPNSAQTATH